MAGLGINNYGISLSSLEQVFINVTNSDAKPADLMDKTDTGQEFVNIIDRSSYPINIDETKVRDEPIQSNRSIVESWKPCTQRDTSRLSIIHSPKNEREEPIQAISPSVRIGNQGYP
jgi:hypothetical protein